jgi:type IV pilus assembly protein PilC
MPQFTYVVRNAAGRKETGTRESATAAALIGELRRSGWMVLDVAPERKSSLDLSSIHLNPFHYMAPRSVDVEVSLQQIAVMLRSGLTLLTSLKLVAEYSVRPSMRKVWTQVAEKIQQGSSLADALGEFRCFPQLVVQLVRVGEQTGTLEDVVTRASESMQRRRLLRNQMVTALTYPMIVVVAAFGVAGFMVVSVIPKLQVFLRALGRKLPPVTQALIDVSTLIQNYGPWFALGFLALTGGLIAVYLWPPGRVVFDRILLKIPVIGRLFRLAATVQFSQALMVLLRSGITLVEGLRTVEGLIRNRWAALRVERARQALIQGSPLAAQLEGSTAFMPMLPRMVAVGESAGTLDEVLEEVGKFHEQQLQSAIKTLSTIIEPALVVVVGGVVGFVYISFFMALFAAAGSGGR